MIFIFLALKIEKVLKIRPQNPYRVVEDVLVYRNPLRRKNIYMNKKLIITERLTFFAKIKGKNSRCKVPKS